MGIISLGIALLLTACGTNTESLSTTSPEGAETSASSVDFDDDFDQFDQPGEEADFPDDDTSGYYDFWADDGDPWTGRPYQYAVHPAEIWGTELAIDAIVFDPDLGLFIDQRNGLIFSEDSRYLLWPNGYISDTVSGQWLDPNTQVWYYPDTQGGGFETHSVTDGGGDNLYAGDGYFFDSGSGCSVVQGEGVSC